jgi:carnitine-CoA ligase
MALRESIDTARTLMTEGRDVPWLLRQWAQRSPEKTFLIWEPFDSKPKHWTFSEFEQSVAAVAGFLHQRGVLPGDRVMVHLDNSPEFLISWFACAYVGAVVVSTNTRSVARDMTYFAEQVSPVAAITQPRYANLVATCAPDIRFLVVSDHDSGVPASHGVDSIAFQDMLESDCLAPARDPEPLANLGIQFTSGTTSRPKAVLWTHANALWGAQMNALNIGLRHDDIALTFLPLFHTNAQSYSMLGSLWVGGTMVLQPRFSASRFWDVSIRNQCTWSSMVRFCVKALMQRKEAPSHRYRFWGPAVSLPNVDEYFGVKTFGWWGMTETITLGILGDLAHPGPSQCIGRPSAGYDIEIRRPDGIMIGPGECGALFIRGVRGVSLFKEYFNNPGANEKAFDQEGWFDTGDLIRMDTDGNLFFADRDKDMLKVGGENVSASEVEVVIMETGWVDECAVVGQKHYMLDEVPVAFVIPLPDAPKDLVQRLIEVCQINLPDFKVVHDVILVDSLPRGTLEKVAKNELRERLQKITEKV